MTHSIFKRVIVCSVILFCATGTCAASSAFQKNDTNSIYGPGTNIIWSLIKASVAEHFNLAYSSTDTGLSVTAHSYDGVLKKLFENPALKSLILSSSMQDLMQSGNIAGMLDHAEFQNLFSDDLIRKLMSSVSEKEQSTIETQQQSLAETMSRVWRNAQKMQDEQLFNKLFNDTGFQNDLKNQNYAGLLQSDTFRKLTEMLLRSSGETDEQIRDSDDMPHRAAAELKTGASSEGNVNFDAGDAIYRWYDRDGTVHYSSEPPDHVTAQKPVSD